VENVEKPMWKAVQDLEIDEYIVLNAMNSLGG
jgi:hypothetical protein